MMSLQQDFLRFTDWKNEFSGEEFDQFLAEFDIHHPEFLQWIEQHQAPYAYFQFYVLLVKNYLNQQQNFAEILDFLFNQEQMYLGGFIQLIKKPQAKYPDLFDLEKFEEYLIQHLQNKELEIYFSTFKSLFSGFCLHYFRFQKLPTYLCQQVTANNGELVYELTMCCHWHNYDYGILDKLLEFNAQGHHYYNSYHDLKNWAECTEDSKIQEKIATIMQFSLNDRLKDLSPYFYEPYLHALQNHQANTIESYIDFLRYLPNTKTKELLNQLIENQNLHIAIRFESVLIYFLTFQQQHPLKQELTHTLLTLPLNERWGGSSSNNGFVYSFDLFKQNDFFSLDEILLALNNTQWCYTACKALYDYSDNIAIQQKIVTTVSDAVAAMIQRMLKVNADDYVTAEPIGNLVSVLKAYNLNSEQKQKLEFILIDGLERCIAHFTEQKHLHQEMVEMIYSLGFNVPDDYTGSLSSWTKLELSYHSKGLSKPQVWQMLIDAEVIQSDATLELDEPIFPNFLGSANMLTYSSRNNDYSFYDEIFKYYLPFKIKWLYDEEQIKSIPADQLIYLNQEDSKLEWRSIEHLYFKYDEKYYTFFIYNFMSRDWVNFPSIVSIFNQILKYFNIHKTIYQLKDTEGFGRDDVFFSAHPEKFTQINQVLGIECIESDFFTPEAKTPQFLAIENEYKNIIQNGGFISSSDQNLIKIPETESMTSKQAQQWLVSNKDEMRNQALNYLAQNDFSQKAIDIRNLFISLALNMVGDYCVAHNLKKRFPLWQNTRYLNENFNLKQRVDLLDTIFNADDLAIHLKYPYD